MLALFGVLENLSGLRIDANFIARFAAFHPEGIAKAAAAFFLFKFLCGYGAGAGLQGNGTGVVYFYLRLRSELLTGIGEAPVATVTISPAIASRRVRDCSTMNASIGKRV